MNGFTETDYINFRYLIQANLLQVIAQIIQAARKLKIDIDSGLEVRNQR